MTSNYYALNTQAINSEETFFKQITTLLLKTYKPNPNKTKPTSSSLSINVSIPLINNNKDLFAYVEFIKWFTKANFKYTFYSSSSFSTKTLYIDNVLIKDYHIDNDISKATSAINQIQYSFHLLELIIKPFLYGASFLYYTRTPKAYITIQFIVREPLPDLLYIPTTTQ